jgi:hypothetical protein
VRRTRSTRSVYTMQLSLTSSAPPANPRLCFYCELINVSGDRGIESQRVEMLNQMSP